MWYLLIPLVSSLAYIDYYALTYRRRNWPPIDRPGAEILAFPIRDYDESIAA